MGKRVISDVEECTESAKIYSFIHYFQTQRDFYSEKKRKEKKMNLFLFFFFYLANDGGVISEPGVTVRDEFEIDDGDESGVEELNEMV